MMARMENVNRRDVFLGLAAMAAGLATAEGQGAGEDVLSTSRSYQFDELKVNQKRERRGEPAGGDGSDGDGRAGGGA